MDEEDDAFLELEADLIRAFHKTLGWSFGNISRSEFLKCHRTIYKNITWYRKDFEQFKDTPYARLLPQQERR